jgi:hypothetical protein
MSRSPDQTWPELVRATLLELDLTQLPERIERAHAAIQERQRQLALESNHHEERQALLDALHSLRALRSDIKVSRYGHDGTHFIR